MRTLLITITIISLFSCKESENFAKRDFEQSLIGRWTLVEASFSIGGPQIIETINDGDEYTFSDDLTFTNSASPECISGTYSVQEDTLSDFILTLKYDCSRIDTPIDRITYGVNFVSSDQFILVPYNPMCIEGCSYTYQKR